MKQKNAEKAPERKTVFTRFITLRNGKRLYAAAYGLKAFKIEVRK